MKINPTNVGAIVCPTIREMIETPQSNVARKAIILWVVRATARTVRHMVLGLQPLTPPLRPQVGFHAW